AHPAPGPSLAPARRRNTMCRSSCLGLHPPWATLGSIQVSEDRPMKHPLAAALAVALAAVASAPASAQDPQPAPVNADSASQARSDNPLLVDSPLPLGYPQFDKLRDEHSAPALEAGMAQEPPGRGAPP